MINLGFFLYTGYEFEKNLGFRHQESVIVVRGSVRWEKIIKCADGRIDIHITKTTERRVKGLGVKFHFRIPNRIGMDFYAFQGKGSHDYIPNINLSDMVQLITYLDLLSKEIVREALLANVIPHKLGVEFDFRRRLDLDVEEVSEDGEQRIVMYYEDPKRFERFVIGWIEVERIPQLIRGLKECIVEYSCLINKLLLLKA